MAKITQLKRGSENVYPLVHMDGVVDDNGNSISTMWDTKQETLVSGSNIKTVNGTSLLGSGDLAVVSVDAGNINVLQSTGSSQVDVMSQKAVTDEINGLHVLTERLSNDDLSSVDNMSFSFPDGYIPCEYIKTGVDANHRGSLNTGIIPNGTTWRFVVKMKCESTPTNMAGALFGLWNTAANNSYLVGINNRTTVIKFNYYQKAQKTISNKNIYDWHVYDWNASRCMVDNTSATWSGSSTTYTNTQGMYISSMALWSVQYIKVYDGDTLVADMKPCINPNNVAGFYDVVREQFFTTSTEGAEFVAFGIRSNPSNRLLNGEGLASLITQETGNSESKMMSQKAITNAITEEPIRKNKYSNYHVFASAAACYSVDAYDLDELKVISSRRITDVFTGIPLSYHYNQGHILGIVSATNPSNDYFSLFNDAYQVYIRLRKNGVNTDYALGNYYFYNNKVQRFFTQIDFYGKKLSLYAKNESGNIITLVDRYDFSALDFSNLQKVKIATSVGSSHNNALVNNLIRINVYTVVPADQLNTAITFGEYNNVAATKFITKPATPSTYMFTNESATAGVTVTLNDPLHKIVEVDRDTAGLVYNWGFYAFGSSPLSSNAYEICKLTFTNVESNLLIKGWSENGGDNFILDQSTYTYTRIPMDSTGTVLEYPIEEGKTYYLIYALGNGYSTRYNHYIGGHFTMEITEPTTYTIGAQNLCAEIFDGKYFDGHIPFVASGNPVPSFYGQFMTNSYPNMTGRFRISSGNVQVYNGSVWKQINNS